MIFFSLSTVLSCIEKAYKIHWKLIKMHDFVEKDEDEEDFSENETKTTKSIIEVYKETVNSLNFNLIDLFD